MNPKHHFFAQNKFCNFEFLDLRDCTVPDGPEQSLGLEPGFFIL